MPISTCNTTVSTLTESPPVLETPDLGASAVLEVDLAAIVANWRMLSARHASGPVAGVVKADAYGLGAAHIAPALYRAGCRHFFVAHLSEALTIRPLVPLAMVAILNGVAAAQMALCAAHDIAPVLGSLADVAALSAEAARAGRALPALLHVETGMARLGVGLADLATLAAEPQRLAGVSLRYVMTHLVAAQDRAAPNNEAQLARFAAARALLPGLPHSLANSSGLFLGARFGSDLARPGAALYGINPTPNAANPLRATVRLRARVLQLRHVSAGESVGYDATWQAARPSRIACVGIGYADGWRRALSNRQPACFDGTPMPLVGRVSMDLTTYDATDVPALAAGDWLELIGPHITVDDVAAAAETNGYEILAGLGPRIVRRYSSAEAA